MRSTWSIVRLGDVLQQEVRAHTPLPGTTYRQIGVKLWGEGAYEREPIDGSQTRYTSFFRVDTGDIIVNKIWARNGSVAVVPVSLAGCFCSAEFPIFAPKLQELDPRWIHWLMKTPGFWTQCEEISQGTSGKNRIKPQQFLSLSIPLPPIKEQSRIVARIDELAAQITEARTLRQQLNDEVDLMLRTIISQDPQAKPTRMAELVRLRPPDVIVRAEETYSFAGVYCFGRGVFRGQAKSGVEFAYKKLTRLNQGDFVYPKLMAWEGAMGIVPPDCDGCFVSTEFPVFEILQDRVIPEVLDIHFRTPSVWPLLAGVSTGTNVRRRRLNPRDFLQYQIPLPSLARQDLLRKALKDVNTIKRLQDESAAELNTLLPSILDRAFKGEHL